MSAMTLASKPSGTPARWRHLRGRKYRRYVKLLRCAILRHRFNRPTQRQSARRAFPHCGHPSTAKNSERSYSADGICQLGGPQIGYSRRRAYCRTELPECRCHAARDPQPPLRRRDDARRGRARRSPRLLGKLVGEVTKRPPRVDRPPVPSARRGDRPQPERRPIADAPEGAIVTLKVRVDRHQPGPPRQLAGALSHLRP